MRDLRRQSMGGGREGEGERKKEARSSGLAERETARRPDGACRSGRKRTKRVRRKKKQRGRGSKGWRTGLRGQSEAGDSAAGAIIKQESTGGDQQSCRERQGRGRVAKEVNTARRSRQEVSSEVQRLLPPKIQGKRAQEPICRALHRRGSGFALVAHTTIETAEGGGEAGGERVRSTHERLTEEKTPPSPFALPLLPPCMRCFLALALSLDMGGHDWPCCAPADAQSVAARVLALFHLRPSLPRPMPSFLLWRLRPLPAPHRHGVRVHARMFCAGLSCTLTSISLPRCKQCVSSRVRVGSCVRLAGRLGRE